LKSASLPPYGVARHLARNGPQVKRPTDPTEISMTRLFPALAATALLAGPAAAFDITAMSEAEKAAFREEIRAYLLENPEVLMEAISVLENREQAEAIETDKRLLAANHDAIFNDPASWVGGNPDGDITVVEFIDYRCGYCRKAWQEVDQLIEQDGNIRFVMKEFPILGEGSVLSSRFAISVLQLHGPDAYKAAHDALLSLRADATPETLRRLAGDLGHDADAILAHMDKPEVTAIIEANHQLAQTLQISGTPTFVIDGTFVRGYVPLDGMQKIVADQRADG
jgi:protein-disulfide isomerase